MALRTLHIKNLLASLVVILIYDFGVISEGFSYFIRCEFINVIIMCYSYMLFDGTDISEVICKMKRVGGSSMILFRRNSQNGYGNL